MGDPSMLIQCGECGTAFVFTAAEREFFAARGLVPPKRCRACRAARRQDVGSAREMRGRGNGSGNANANAHARWAATCTGCGAGTSVPFEPSPGRDVFCKPCWDARKNAIVAPDLNDPGIIE